MASALTINGHVATVSLEGLLDADRVSELSGFSDHIAEDASLRACVLRASSETWAGWSDAALVAAEQQGLVGDPFGSFASLPQATLVVLDGDVRDGGLELALCADIRVAGPETTLGLPGAAAALPIAGGLQRLSRAVGRARALELVLTGTPIDASKARAWGLVSKVGVDAAGEAVALAGRIAERGPIAVRFAKEALNRGIEMPLEQALGYETDLTVLLQTTADRAEGVAAFIEKRTPTFRGE
jgi:enoyl-CoA hydratase/carnithine racemase